MQSAYVNRVGMFEYYMYHDMKSGEAQKILSLKIWEGPKNLNSKNLGGYGPLVPPLMSSQIMPLFGGQACYLLHVK